ncbi:hypothetical protein DSL72_002972 [Monilinia vaccinii-corymbosi]|uniref:Uncharacterized protein n=1 Tax=Monilinia vaccinii-corymbosi TaxID=61207 RepID=A0A8A3PE90_9HELO|nr:hypothetical protein DSL72_002972 [Monilinia vaccinii-corymbosi]
MSIAYLDKLVPSRGDNDRVLWVRAESNARNPVGVSLLSDGELAVTEGVPQLNCTVAGPGDNLSVIGRERNGKDVIVVSNKSAGGGSSGKLPKAESPVPGGGKSVSTIGGDHLEIKKVLAFHCQFADCAHNSKRHQFQATYTVRNDVRVPVERSLWVTIGSLVASQIPDDERLVARTRQEHVWVLERSRKGGDPAAVALEGALEDKLFRHVGVIDLVDGKELESGNGNKELLLWEIFEKFRGGGRFT